MAYIRERLEAGERPEIAQLRTSLQHLSASDSRPHADYGVRQLALLARVGGPGSAEHGRFAGQPLGVELS